LKISEAMRKGFAISEPCICAFILECDDKSLISCAAGAVLLGSGEDWREVGKNHIRSRLYELFPQLNWVYTFTGGASLMTWITNQNDTREMTREEIAETLESNGL